MKNSIIYTRVSTKEQSTVRQLNELLDLTKRDGANVVNVIKEKISGTKALFKRKLGSEIEGMVVNKKVDCIYVHEISRLGRNVADVANTIEFLIKHECNLRVMDAGLSLFRDGEVDISARMVINVLVSLAQNERDLLSKRTKSGLKIAKAKGSQIGAVTTGAGKEARKLLSSGVSVMDTHAKTGINLSHLYKIKRGLK
tara:strand:+ start:821 stop:1414 length:594 start_codon:yes stop_codon:yes gene_type:complete